MAASRKRVSPIRESKRESCESHKFRHIRMRSAEIVRRRRARGQLSAASVSVRQLAQNGPPRVAEESATFRERAQDYLLFIDPAQSIKCAGKLSLPA